MGTDIKSSLRNFNAKEWLDAKGIPWKPTGENVSEGWIGIECPFCPDSDPSNHLGISPTNNINCFRCGKHGSIWELIKLYEETSINAFKSLTSYSEHSEIAEEDFSKEKAQFCQRELKLKTLFDSFSELSEEHCSYLQSRQFNPNFIKYQYEVKSGIPGGRWTQQLIVPIFLNHKLVTFTARDTTSLLSRRYTNCPNELSVIPVKQCLYNIDRAKEETVLVVEGVTSVWRIGEGTVATMGEEYTKQQIKSLKDKKRVFIMFDQDETAQKQADNLGWELGGAVKEVVVIDCPYSDPAEIPDSEVPILRKELFKHTN